MGKKTTTAQGLESVIFAYSAFSRNAPIWLQFVPTQIVVISAITLVLFML
jgi:hypothetical protein